MKNQEARQNRSSEIAFILLLFVGGLAVVSGGDAQGTSTWPDLFIPTCSSGGCLSYYPQCPSSKQYFFTTDDSISINAMNTDGTACMAIEAYDKCRFLIGDEGVTHVTFDFTISQTCYSPTETIAWLSFWMRSQPYSSRAEVDFVESKHGPAINGLNTNFDAHGCQVPIYCGTSSEPPTAGCPPLQACTPSTEDWTGSVTALFTGPPDEVKASVSTTSNGNVGTSTLTGGPTSLSNGMGYYFLMDVSPETTGVVISKDCYITVSKLAVRGTVPSTIDGKPNCTGLPITSP